MNLENLKSIHWNEPTEVISHAPRGYRKKKRSPAEEFTWRTAFSKLERIPDALAAMMMREIRCVEIQKNGIKFDFQGESYLYWHPESKTCDPSNLGKKVTFSFDRDCLDVIYVLERGRYIETIPLKNKVQWFSKETEKEIASHQRVINRTHEQIKKARGRDTESLYARVKANAQKIQELHTMTPPQVPEESTSRFVKAEALQLATQKAQKQKKRMKEHHERVKKAKGSLESLEPVERISQKGNEEENEDMSRLHELE